MEISMQNNSEYNNQVDKQKIVGRFNYIWSCCSHFIQAYPNKVVIKRHSTNLWAEQRFRKMIYLSVKMRIW